MLVPGKSNESVSLVLDYTDFSSFDGKKCEGRVEFSIIPDNLKSGGASLHFRYELVCAAFRKCLTCTKGGHCSPL